MILSASTRAILAAHENKGLAGALRALIAEHKEYNDDGCGRFVVFCEDIWTVIDDIERYAQVDNAISCTEVTV